MRLNGRACALALVALFLLASCGGGSDDEGSAAVEERFTDPEISVDLDVPAYDPQVVADADLEFLPENEAACVGDRLSQGQSASDSATLSGCVSAESVATLLAREGLELSTSEALCIFDARTEFEQASLEAETTVQNLDLLDAVQVDTVNCMTDETIAARIGNVFPGIEMSATEARCALQAELIDDVDVFGLTAWCGIAGRVLVADGLAISAEGAGCVDERGQAALPQTTTELPLLVADCVSDDDQAVIDEAFSE